MFKHSVGPYFTNTKLAEEVPGLPGKVLILYAAITLPL